MVLSQVVKAPSEDTVIDLKVVATIAAKKSNVLAALINSEYR